METSYTAKFFNYIIQFKFYTSKCCLQNTVRQYEIHLEQLKDLFSAACISGLLSVSCVSNISSALEALK